VSSIRFWKYEATGNDFVMVLDLDDELDLTPAEVAACCDRRFGVGADGTIRVTRPAESDGRLVMDYRNADGSVAETCGNGIRCVARFAHDRGLVEGSEFDVLTGAGAARVRLHLDGGAARSVTVGMGVPAFAKSAIPMRGPAWETFLVESFDLGGGITVKASAISMGNPHLVLFVDDPPERFHVGHIGPMLEHHDLFPEGTNVEFAHVVADAVEARVWERGSGETMACGSGACAVAVAANEAGLVPARTTVHFPGGSLDVERSGSGEVFLTGPAEPVFEGTVDPAALAAARARRS
jgi:diaminopimelate epimerase